MQHSHEVFYCWYLASVSLVSFEQCQLSPALSRHDINTTAVVSIQLGYHKDRIPFQATPNPQPQFLRLSRYH